MMTISVMSFSNKLSRMLSLRLSSKMVVVTLTSKLFGKMVLNMSSSKSLVVLLEVCLKMLSEPTCRWVLLRIVSVAFVGVVCSSCLNLCVCASNLNLLSVTNVYQPKQTYPNHHHNHNNNQNFVETTLSKSILKSWKRIAETVPSKFLSAHLQMQMPADRLNLMFFSQGSSESVSACS